MTRRLNDVTPDEWTDSARRYEGHGVWDDFFDTEGRVSVTEDFDPVEKPKHYNNGRYETIDVIVDTLGEWEAISYCHGNVLKYTIRLWNKGHPIQDAEKAKWYLNKMIELMHKTKGGNW
jgi:hypothetical protein